MFDDSGGNNSNPDLIPETVKTMDLMWLGHWQQTYLSFGYFESHFKNSIVTISLPDGVNQNANIDQGPTKGFELEAFHEMDSHWSLRGTYTNITEKPDLSFREANQLASVEVNYQNDKWNVNFVSILHDERESPISGSERITLNKYQQLNSKVLYDFTKRWQGFVQVKNLLNENYQTPAVSATLVEGVVNRGQEVLLGVTGRF